MRIVHLGYEIICGEMTSWDRSLKSNRLTVYRLWKGQNLQPERILEMWWPSKISAGIKYGVALVDRHVKAMTITPGKG